MDLISILIRLAAVGAVVGSLYFVASSVNDVIREHYVAPVKAAYEARLTVIDNQLDAERHANASLMLANANAQASVDACNAKVDDIKRVSDAAIKTSNSALEAARARAARDQSMIQGLVARAQGPKTEGEFCEQAQVAYRALVDLANRQRLRDQPAGAPGAGPGEGSSGAGQSPVH